MKQGFFVLGKCVGFAAEQWARNGKSGTNYRLGISREYEGHFGQVETDTMQIDVAQDIAQKIEKQVAMLKGQPVAIRVIPSAKVGGKNGAWLSLFAPKDSDLIPQTGLTASSARPAVQAANG
jgi:hypothetical protein